MYLEAKGSPEAWVLEEFLIINDTIGLATNLVRISLWVILTSLSFKSVAVNSVIGSVYNNSVVKRGGWNRILDAADELESVFVDLGDGANGGGCEASLVIIFPQEGRDDIVEAVFVDVSHGHVGEDSGAVCLDAFGKGFDSVGEHLVNGRGGGVHEELEC